MLGNPRAISQYPNRAIRPGSSSPNSPIIPAGSCSPDGMIARTIAAPAQACACWRPIHLRGGVLAVEARDGRELADVLVSAGLAQTLGHRRAPRDEEGSRLIPASAAPARPFPRIAHHPARGCPSGRRVRWARITATTLDVLR
jgi:hypothetical protein